eukprot:CAMPEP_0184491372 /NCGR_PEP_ID=MMETSP0113_2-20130426/20266_1 /TAXON_ID=91329 /ORGANISM="Norrisiella sphaerica, Strain BC52" /LENGTH=112 /DNA_ID=CAMNT_0026875717 /DNA_START=334 /DNA_END=672 /DNA_ORIENTATION=-
MDPPLLTLPSSPVFEMASIEYPEKSELCRSLSGMGSISRSARHSSDSKQSSSPMFHVLRGISDPVLVRTDRANFRFSGRESENDFALQFNLSLEFDIKNSKSDEVEIHPAIA